MLLSAVKINSILTSFFSEALYLFVVSRCSLLAHPLVSRAVVQSTTPPLGETSQAHSQNIWEALPGNQDPH